jgi:hypothetical protein
MLTAMLRYSGLTANQFGVRSNGIALFPNRTAFYVIAAVETPKE